MFGRNNVFDNDPFFNDPFFSSPLNHNDPFASMHTHMNSMMEQHNRMFNSMLQQQQQFTQPQIQHQRYNNNQQQQQYLPARSGVQIEEIPHDNTVQHNNSNTRVHVEEVDDDDNHSTVDNNSIAVHHTNTDRYGNTYTRVTGRPQQPPPQYYSESYSSYTVQQSNGQQPPVVKQQSRHTTNMNGVHETKSAVYDSERDYRAAGIQRGIADRSIAAVQQQYGTAEPQRSISYNGINESNRQQFTQQWNNARHQQLRSISDSTQRNPPLPAAPVPQYTPTTRTVTQAQLPGRGSSTGNTYTQRPHIDTAQQYDSSRYNTRSSTTQPQPFTGQSYRLKDSH